MQMNMQTQGGNILKILKLKIYGHEAFECGYEAKKLKQWHLSSGSSPWNLKNVQRRYKRLDNIMVVKMSMMLLLQRKVPGKGTRNSSEH